MGKIYKNSILYSGGGGSGTGGGHTIYNTDDTAMPQETGLQFKGLKVTDDSANSETDVEAFGLNNDSLDDVTSGSVPTGFIQPAFNYSTNEQIVGKWLDGKPIYQKTFELNNPTDGMTIIPSGIARLVSSEIAWDRSDGGSGFSYAVNSGANTFQNGPYPFVYGGALSLYVRGSISCTKVIITVRYVKS